MDNPSPSDAARGQQRQAMAGLLVRKACWTLSGRGKIILAIALVGTGLIAFCKAQSFLSVTEPTHGKVLVVEGWIPAYALRQAIVEFRNGGYREVVTSGCLTHEDSGERVGSTYADWGAQRLQRYGLSAELITPIPCYVEHRDRTYSSALTVRQWLEHNRPDTIAIDVLTLDAHARRSRLLFQKALGDRFNVGIIAVPDSEYDPKHWWRSSEGVREILGESIAYIYARFFFWPLSHEPEQSQR
jgi:uncharacterized SAM-binding protein YcdF (DUF218 family)